MLDDLVDVQNAMRLWKEDEGADVIEQMRGLLQQTYTDVPPELPMRELLRVLDQANRHVHRAEFANNAFAEMLEMTSDP